MDMHQAGHKHLCGELITIGYDYVERVLGCTVEVFFLQYDRSRYIYCQ